MNIKMKRSIKSVGFCALAIEMIIYLTFLSTPKWLDARWSSSQTHRTFYEVEKNTVDVLFLGSSVVAAGIDPYQMYKEQGISAYNLGTVSQNTSGTYYWLKESLMYQSPKVVCVEIKPVARKSDKEEKKARKSYDFMNWGLNKLEYGKVSSQIYGTDWFDYLFPLSLYHDRWSSLEYEDYDFMSGGYKSYTRGFATLTTYSTETGKKYTDYAGIEEDKNDVGDGWYETNREYLEKIIETCKKENIPLILMKTVDPKWTTKAHNYIESIVSEYEDVPFIDFNSKDLIKELNFNYAVDGCDYFHVNMFGAKKMTSYMSKYIKANYEVPDRRKDEKVSKIFDEELPYYEDAYYDAIICFETNPLKYIDNLKKDRFSIIIASGTKGIGNINETYKKALMSLGIEEAFFKTNKKGTNNICILEQNNKQTIASPISAQSTSITESGTFKSGKTYSVTSGVGCASVTIEDENRVVNKNGINLVVYDNEIGRVADSVCLTVNANGTLTLSR